MDEKRKQDFFEELEKLSSEECYVGQKHYDEPKRSGDPDDYDWCGTSDDFFTNKLIMEFHAIKNGIKNLFRKIVQKFQSKIALMRLTPAEELSSFTIFRWCKSRVFLA